MTSCAQTAVTLEATQIAAIVAIFVEISILINHRPASKEATKSNAGKKKLFQSVKCTCCRPELKEEA